MEKRDESLLILYALVFAFGFYTNMKISQQNTTVEEIRQFNKDTWLIS